MPSYTPIGARTAPFRKRTALVGALVIAAIVSTIIWSRSRRYIPAPKLVLADHGAVSSENPLCSEAGIELLRMGGSAVDAMIGASLCIGVTNMYSSGIGGGGFMLIRKEGKFEEYIDFREEAPLAAFTDMFNTDPKKAQVGGLSVGVPGEIRGFEIAHERHGKLKWAQLFEASIRIARDGWAVTKTLASRIKSANDWILRDPEFRDVFAPEGVPLVEGQIIKRIKLARTLEKIAQQGARVFYEGEIARSLVAAVQNAGGILTLEDMKQYRAKIGQPLIGYYHGKRVITVPAPASGAVLLSILNIIEGYNLPATGNTALNKHRLVEAFKYAYAQRSFYGDPIDPVYLNISSIERKFIDKQVAENIRHNISSDQTFDPLHYQPQFDVQEDHGTMHVSVLTTDGEAASLTSTVNLLFGAQFMDPATGIILNDEMDDFSIPGHPNAFGLEPSPYNYVHPRKRPLSSSVPTIVEADGRILCVLGASGGSRIITATVMVLLNIVDFKMDMAAAVQEPRMHHQLLPHEIHVEYEFDTGISKELQRRGHVVSRMAPGLTLTGVEGMRRREDGKIEASSDARKGGISAGW